MVLLLMVTLPVLFAVLIAFYGENSKSLRNTLVMIPSVFNFFCVIYLTNLLLKGGSYSFSLVEIPPFSISFKADMFSVYMGLSMTFLWILTNIYSFGYMAHEHAQRRYFYSLTCVLGATMGIIFSANLISFFIFFEWLTVAVYPLVIHEESDEAFEAGVKYGAYLLTGGIAVLIASAIIYSLTGGNVTFYPGGIPELAAQNRSSLLIIFLLFVFGFGFKSAIVPMHSWLPDAMIAPTPISAVLHAVAVVNVGLTGFYRVVYNVFGFNLFKALGFDTLLAIPAAITIIIAAILGLRQKEIKRMLAFSTVNQLSYILMGIASGVMVGMLGGLLHIIYHAFMKITLFYCAGLIITQSGNKYISKMGGLAKKMPITMIAFAIAAIGIVGLPPVCGWISKWYLVNAYLNIGKPVYAAVFLLSGILELGYLGPPVFLAFFGREEKVAPLSPGPGNHLVNPHPEHGQNHPRNNLSRRPAFFREAPVTMLVPVIITCLGTVIYGIWGFVPHYLANITLTNLLGG